MTPALATAAPAEAPVAFGDLAETPLAVQWAAARAVADAATDLDDARTLLEMLGLDRLRGSRLAA